MPSRKDHYRANEELLRKLDVWLAARGGTATLADVLATNDGLLLGAFLLRGFRRAARDAVFDRLRHNAGVHGLAAPRDPLAALLHMVDHLADAWSLEEGEKVRLLGFGNASKLDALRGASLEDVPTETLERAAMLLDIFAAINALLPRPERADRWVRAPNAAPLFSGKSALDLMLRDGLEGIATVRAYLRGAGE